MNSFKFKPSLYLLAFLLVSADFLVLYLSLEAAQLTQSLNVDIASYSWIPIFILSSFATQKIYVIRYDFWGDAKKILKVFFFSFFVVFTVISLAKISDVYSVPFLLNFFVIAMFATLFFKRLLKKLLFSFDFFKIKVMVMADEESYKTICGEIKKNWYFGYEVNDENYDIVIIS